MATKIEWSQETLNPFFGCTKVSDGCKNCYAEKMARRLVAMGLKHYNHVLTDGKWNNHVVFNPSVLEIIPRWKKPRIVFVNSMSDTFHENMNNSWIDELFGYMNAFKKHTFILLTKRPERALQYYKEGANYWLIYKRACEVRGIIPNVNGFTRPDMLDNVWLGVTAENQAMADKRIPILLQIPAAKRFVSVEPMLGPVELFNVSQWANVEEWWGRRLEINWVICGSESGPGRRPFNEDWARHLRDQCIMPGIPFFYKQRYIGNKKFSMPLLDGKVWDQIPER
jgi:protein gp37